MGAVIKKIPCIGGTHEDRTPSMAVYADNSMYCFSCRSYFGPTGNLPVVEVKKEPENLTEKYVYIEKLPTITHRGLLFHYDARGYYIVWPGGGYYKLRLWAPKPGEPKYYGAKGHKKPWFCLRAYEKTKTCIITEGEINALSIAAVRNSEVGGDSVWDIVSPGGATNFYDAEMKSRVDVFKNYDTLIVLVDADKAGVEGAIGFHKLAKPYCSDIRIRLLEKGRDANDILNLNDGKKELYKTIMGL